MAERREKQAKARRGSRNQKNVRVKVFNLIDPVFDVGFMITAGLDFNAARQRWAKAMKIDLEMHDMPSQLACVTTSPERPSDVLISFRDVQPAGYVVAHEAFHATYAVMRRSGVELSKCSEEAFAYHLSWLVRMIGREVW